MLIDVIYLARGKDWGLEAADKFFASYEKYPAGAEHNLIIAAKAWDEKPEEYKKLCEKAQEFDAEIIDLPDDGYDFGAYYRVAKNSKADYILCLVSTSEICVDDWLLKFTKAFEANPHLKYASTTASYQTTPNIAYYDEVTIKNKYNVHSIRFRLLKPLMALDDFRRKIIAKMYSAYKFPNPHIRTNAFMIERSLYITFIDTYGLPKNKMDAYQLESGIHGLTQFIKKKNFDYRVIGANGHVYEEKDWPTSQTLADFNVSNTLIKDNWSAHFYKTPTHHQKFNERFRIWGTPYKENYSKPILFSVLLPTKDRLELLKHAIDSILNQTYPHWELIISDNFSKENIKNYIETLNDSRIVYSKTVQPIPVTRNWNNTQDKSNGDYIIMLGDDDALLPNFFEKCLHYLEMHQYPELLNFGAYQYMQMNVSPQLPNGFSASTAKRLYSYMRDCAEPYLLDLETRKKMVQASFQFNYQFAFNMQYFLYSKNLAFELMQDGQVYEGPYPDYYAANAMMLLAEKVLILPEDLLIIGITPKSYGYYYLNNKEKDGLAFHNQAEYRNYVHRTLSGKLCNVADMETAALATFAHIPARFPKYNLKLDFPAYYKAVIRRIIRDYDKKEAWSILLKEIFPRVSVLHWYMYLKYIIIGMKRKISVTVQQSKQDTSENGYENISLLIEDIVNGKKIKNLIE